MRYSGRRQILPLEIAKSPCILGVMKVTGYGTIKPTTNLRRRDGTSGVGAFSDFLSAAQTESSSATSEVSDIATAGAVGSLLALQEISEEERRRERLVKHGKTMLDALENLRLRLLIGDIPSHMLSELSQTLAEQKTEVSDPNLMALIEDIELRVAVELAKLEMAFAARAEI